MSVRDNIISFLFVISSIILSAAIVIPVFAEVKFATLLIKLVLPAAILFTVALTLDGHTKWMWRIVMTLSILLIPAVVLVILYDIVISPLALVVWVMFGKSIFLDLDDYMDWCNDNINFVARKL